MTMKTGHEIWNDVEDADMVEDADILESGESAELAEQKWYLASDIDKRIEFFKKYITNRPKFIRDVGHIKIKEITGYTYIPTVPESYCKLLCLFCFTNLDKDFDELMDLEEK